MLRDQLRGTGVALVTPFNADYEVDYEGLGRIIDFVIRDGAEYVITLGTTGETPTLNDEEKLNLINFTFEKVNGIVPVVVGVGGNDTRESIKKLETLPLDKAIAVLSISPHYNRPSQEGIYAHYKALAEVSPKPLILYNVPIRTGRNIEAETTVRLAGVDNIAGIKESGGDVAQCIKILKDKPADFFVVSGEDAMALPLIACGMDGVISVAANCLPKAYTEMVRTCLKGDFKTAKRMNNDLVEAYELLFDENNPAGVKAFLSEIGLIENYLRLPLVPLSDAMHQKVKQYLKSSDSY